MFEWVGGFSHGIHQAYGDSYGSAQQPECVGISEIDKYAGGTSPASKTTETQQSLFPTNCPTSTFSSVDFLARISQLRETDKGLTGQEALCFLRSHGFYHTSDPDIFYSKMLRASLVTTTVIEEIVRWMREKGCLGKNGRGCVSS